MPKKSGPGRPGEAHPLYAQALALRQQHPTWGAGYIRVRLAGSADPATVSMRSRDNMFAIGRAYFADTCRMNQCQQACR